MAAFEEKSHDDRNEQNHDRPGADQDNDGRLIRSSAKAA